MRYKMKRVSYDFSPDMPFGKWVKKKRQLMKMSQKELSLFLGVNQGTVSEWERGIRTPTYDDAVYIVKRMGGIVQIINPKEEKEEREDGNTW